MGAVIFCFSLTLLLQVALGSPLDCSTEIKGTHPTFEQVNGPWNVKAVRSAADSLTFFNQVGYYSTRVFATEKEVNLTHFFSPMLGWIGGFSHALRVYSETKMLTYGFPVRSGVAGTMTFIQPHPGSFILEQRENDKLTIAALYIRETSLPQSELNEFHEWAECNKLSYHTEFNFTANYAQTCDGVFEVLNPPPADLEVNTWHLIAKSSSAADRHYDVRILYTARLEFTKDGDNYTLREIITAPSDNTLLELTFGSTIRPDNNPVLFFRTEKDLLLLGVQTEGVKTLYLASRSPDVEQATVDRFKTQAVCFETTYNYYVPRTSALQNDEAESCVGKLEQMVPINFRKSLGKWILTASAHEKADTVLEDISSHYGFTEIGVKDNKVHISHTSIHHGVLYTLEQELIEVDESKGHALYKDSPGGTVSPVYQVSPDCIMFAPEFVPGKLFLNCRANQIFPVADIPKFIEYANCRKYNNIIIRRHSSPSCWDLPEEVSVLDVNKIAGKWNLAAVATNVPPEDVAFPPEIQFVVSDGEVVLTDGNWKSPAETIRNRRLRYAKEEESAMEMRFHNPLGDSLLAWVGNTAEHKVFLVLFSKSGNVEPGEVTKFKHFAACLSIPVTFMKE
ncbi:uncharacterized protein [Hyperolius riggenbachi]|uniref:uncharacterized protein n=1 Tax=Hyperolius riggenbachi TaxID=752182 RepID=UPI0035A303F8